MITKEMDKEFLNMQMEVNIKETEKMDLKMVKVWS